MAVTREQQIKDWKDDIGPGLQDGGVSPESVEQALDEAGLMIVSKPGLWQPIETAPVNEYVLVYCPAIGHAVVGNLDGEGLWSGCSGFESEYFLQGEPRFSPTHWARLLDPPLEVNG